MINNIRGIIVPTQYQRLATAVRIVLQSALVLLAVVTFAPRAADAVVLVDEWSIDSAICVGATGVRQWNDDLVLAEPASACYSVTHATHGVAAFDATATEGFTLTRHIPSDATELSSGGGVDVDLVWRSPETTGSVCWQIQTFCTPTGQTYGSFFNTADSLSDASLGTEDQRNVATISNINMSGCDADEDLTLRVVRNGGGIAGCTDDKANDAYLHRVIVRLRRSQ